MTNIRTAIFGAQRFVGKVERHPGAGLAALILLIALMAAAAKLHTVAKRSNNLIAGSVAEVFHDASGFSLKINVPRVLRTGAEPVQDRLYFPAATAVYPVPEVGDWAVALYKTRIAKGRIAVGQAIEVSSAPRWLMQASSAIPILEWSSLLAMVLGLILVIGGSMAIRVSLAVVAGCAGVWVAWQFLAYGALLDWHATTTLIRLPFLSTVAFTAASAGYFVLAPGTWLTTWVERALLASLQFYFSGSIASALATDPEMMLLAAFTTLILGAFVGRAVLGAALISFSLVADKPTTTVLVWGAMVVTWFVHTLLDDKRRVQLRGAAARTLASAARASSGRVTSVQAMKAPRR